MTASDLSPTPTPAPLRWCLPLGLALGVLGDRLLSGGLPGPGFALWIGLLGAAGIFLAWRTALPRWWHIALWSAVALAAAVSMFLRETEFVQVALWAVLITSASMVMMSAWGARLGASRVSDHLLGLVMVPARALGGALPLLFSARRPAGRTRTHLGSLLRGVLLAAPLLLVFAAIFSSADAAFGRFTSALVNLLDPDLPGHIVLALALGWVAAGLLSAVPAVGWRNPLPELPLPRLGAVETRIVMVSLALLFAAFVLLQLGYLFGGRAVIESVSGLTVAEHARRGFFEMLAAAALTLAVLLVGETLTEDRRSFRGLAALLILCVLVMLASALQRLALYIADFGLTLERVNALAVMAWLALTLVLFAATVLRERPLRFASGAALAGIVAAFALALANPAALVARVNLQRGLDGGRELDLAYLGSLGADAVPVLMRRFDELAEPRYLLSLDPASASALRAQAALADGESLRLARSCRALAPLFELTARTSGEDWRRWNASRAAARQAVARHEQELLRIGERCGLRAQG